MTQLHTRENTMAEKPLQNDQVPTHQLRDLVGVDANGEAAYLNAQAAGATGGNRLATLGDISAVLAGSRTSILANSSFQDGLRGWINNSPYALEVHPEDLWVYIKNHVVPCALDCECGKGWYPQ